WTLATGKSLELPYELPLTIESLTFSDGGKRFVAGGCTRSDRAGCTVFEVRSWDLTKDLQSPRSIEVGIDNFKRPQRTFSPTGDRLFTLTNDGTAKLWDTTSEGKELFDLSTSHVTFPATFSDDGKQLATLSENGSVLIWDVSEGRSSTMEGQFETRETGKADPRFSKGLAFSPNGKLIAAFAGKTLEVWDVKSKRQLMTLSGHKDSITSVEFTGDGQFIATASADGTAKMWETTPLKELLILTTPEEFFGLMDLRFSSDGSRLAGRAAGDTVKEWYANSGKELGTILQHDGVINSFAYRPERKLLAILGNDAGNIWDTSSHKSIWSEAKQASYGCEIVFSPNGKLLAGAKDDKIGRAH